MPSGACGDGSKPFYLCLVNNCPPPVYANSSQKRNASLFSGTLNNPASLSIDSMRYSLAARKVSAPSNWVTRIYTNTPRFIAPLANYLSS